VVDDEPSVRRTAARILASLGYDTLVAGDGDEAAALVSAHTGPIDAVLCDVAMPARSGHKWPRIQHPPRSPGALRQAARTRLAGRQALLSKPYTRAELGRACARDRRVSEPFLP
jgi:hypothetical protein